MSYLGRGLEQVDNISKLDNITFNGGTTYALTKDSSAFQPISSNAILISISGVIQQGNFTVSGTNIVFNTAVASSESCDFIMHYGTGVAFTPADNSITKDKTNFISNSSSSGITSKGDGGSVDGSISLNCSQNSHHTKISSASHGAYSGNLNFVLPSSHGTNGQFMKTDGSGNLSFASALSQASVGGNIDASGNNLFEEITSSAGMPSSGGNKSVDTTYDSTFDVTAGKWFITVNLDVAIFENHGNSNSTGIYLGSFNLGSSAGDSTYGSFTKVLPKWGNGSNSYGDVTGAVLGFQTFSSTTTVHTRWAVYEYGGSSNYWVRGNNTKIRFIRVG